MRSDRSSLKRLVSKRATERTPRSWLGNTTTGPVWRRQKMLLYLLLALWLNLVFAPMVYAVSTHGLTRGQAWSLGLLGLTTVTLSVYLFFVMFVPEKFS